MNMRYIATLTLLVIALFSFGQTKTKSPNNELTIGKEQVTRIEIRNHSGQADSIKTITHMFNEAMTNDLIDRLNNSKSTGPCKYIVLYWLDVYLEDGTKRTFRINGRSIKENNDWCFDIKDSDFAENLWKKLNKE